MGESELNDWLDMFRFVKGFEPGRNSVRSFIQLVFSSLLKYLGNQIH